MAIITLGGHVGAGKTTIANMLEKFLPGYEQLYIGGIMREMAKERGLSIEEFYQRLKEEPGLERSIDTRQEKLMQEHDNLIVQGRMAWFFAKKSPFPVMNVFLCVAPETAAQRLSQREENLGKSIDVIKEDMGLRLATEKERYKLLYGIEDFLDILHYDICINTTKLTPIEVAQKIFQNI